jgi:hypothetical protein
VILSAIVSALSKAYTGYILLFVCKYSDTSEGSQMYCLLLYRNPRKHSVSHKWGCCFVRHGFWEGNSDGFVHSSYLGLAGLMGGRVGSQSSFSSASSLSKPLGTIENFTYGCLTGCQRRCDTSARKTALRLRSIRPTEMKSHHLTAIRITSDTLSRIAAVFFFRRRKRSLAPRNSRTPLHC